MYGKSLADFPQRQEGFLQVLAAVPLGAMDAGFAECLNTCVEFPVPQEVQAAAEKWQLEHRDDAATRQLLDRPDKPADFQPLAGETDATLRALARHRGTVTQEEITRWLEEGKEKGRQRMAKLAEDPKWRAEAAHYGVPEYRVYAESVIAAQNGKTEVPQDPNERRRWARDKAVKGGWVEAREPGDEND